MSLASNSLRTRSYRRDVDGLRSIAILSVVLYHAGVRQFSGGFTGVDIFFAISGYLIGGHINSELTAGTFRFSNFYRNRAKRILPALYFVLIATLLIGLLLLSPREMRTVGMYTFSTTASISNIVLCKTTSYFAPRADQNPLLMTWSLGVEEQFYVVVPVLLVLIAKVRQRLNLAVVLLLSAISLVAAILQVKHSPDAAFYLLTSRAWELGIGVALAIFEVEGRRLPVLQSRRFNELQAWAGLLLVVVPLFLYTSSTPFPGLAALPSVLGSALLLSSEGAWVNEKLLSWAPFMFIGRVSYSFYLWHWPLLSYLRILHGGLLPLAWGLTAVAVAFILAIISYYRIEQPFRSSRRAAGPLLLRYAVVSFLLLAISGLVYQARGFPGRYPSAAAVDQVVESIGGQQDPCLVSEGKSHPNLSATCSGSATPGPHAALWGDSHASAVAPAVRAASLRKGYFLEEYAKTSCPPLYGAGRSYRLQPAALKECIQFNAEVLQHLVADPQIQVVLLESFWDGAFDPHFKEDGKLSVGEQGTDAAPSLADSEQLLKVALTDTLQKLRSAGKLVVVFGDTPVFDIDPVWRMRTRDIPARWKLAEQLNGNHGDLDPGVDYAFDDTAPQKAGELLLQQIATSVPGVTFWNARQHLCSQEGVCTYRQAQAPLFGDTNHVSAAGADRALEGWTFPDASAASGESSGLSDPAGPTNSRDPSPLPARSVRTQD